MNKNNSETEEILSAIKDMMSDSSTLKDQSLPKDILELTKSVKQEDPEKNKNDKEILELTELVSDEDIQTDTNTKLNSSVIGKEIINDDQIRLIVKESLEALPSNQIDAIIREELSNIIKKKLKNIKFTVLPEDNIK